MARSKDAMCATFRAFNQKRKFAVNIDESKLIWIAIHQRLWYFSAWARDCRTLNRSVIDYTLDGCLCLFKICAYKAHSCTGGGATFKPIRVLRIPTRTYSQHLRVQRSFHLLFLLLLPCCCCSASLFFFFFLLFPFMNHPWHTEVLCKR